MPDMNMMNNNPHPDDREAAMARADLYKLANYSMKLFKMIHDGDELEGWVQAKVTKAADYIASVYHYMEYEMKFSEYGNKIENSDMYSESVKQEFKRKLTEARVKLEKLKKTNEKDVEEGWEDMMAANKKAANEKGTGKFDKKKTSTGTVYTRKANTFTDGGDDKDVKAAKKKAKVKEGFFGNDEADLAKKSPQLQQLIALRSSPKYQTPAAKASLEARIKKQMDRVSLDKGEVVGADGKPVAVESAKPDFLDMDKDGNKKEPMKKAIADKKKVKEASKPDFLDMDKDGNKKEPMKKAIADKKKNPFAKKDDSVKEASHQAKTTMKHVKNPTAGEKKAAKDIKAGTAGYADRIAMLKSAEKDGRLKESAERAANAVLAKLRS